MPRYVRFVGTWLKLKYDEYTDAYYDKQSNKFYYSYDNGILRIRDCDYQFRILINGLLSEISEEEFNN